MADRAIKAREQRPLRRYSNVAVAFHWVTAILVLFQIWLGLSFADMARGPEKADLFTWHRTIGALILLVVLARLTYRLFNPPPPYPPELPRWERIAGTWNHRLFYLLLIAMPIGGLLAVSRRPRARRSSCSAASQSPRFRASRKASARSPRPSMSPQPGCSSR